MKVTTMHLLNTRNVRYKTVILTYCLTDQVERYPSGLISMHRVTGLNNSIISIQSLRII